MSKVQNGKSLLITVGLGLLVCVITILYQRMRNRYHHQFVYVSKNSQHFDTVADTLQTGDILFFKCKMDPRPAFVVIANNTPWCHVGIIYRDPETNVLYICESDEKDHLTKSDVFGKTTSGPSMYDFYQRMSHACITGFGIRHLYGVSRDLEFHNAFLEHFHALATCPFIRLIGSKSLRLVVNHTSGRLLIPQRSFQKEGLFCSEFVVEMYKYLGIMSSDTVGELYGPKELEDVILPAPLFLSATECYLYP